MQMSYRTVILFRLAAIVAAAQKSHLASTSAAFACLCTDGNKRLKCPNNAPLVLEKQKASVLGLHPCRLNILSL